MNNYNYTPRCTKVRTRILKAEMVEGAKNGHSRSTPQGISSPIPSKKYKASSRKEVPVDITTSGVNSDTFMEPESPASLEPKSHL